MGEVEGLPVGNSVGKNVGRRVGSFDGLGVGLEVGETVGEQVSEVINSNILVKPLYIPSMLLNGAATMSVEPSSERATFPPK